MVIGMMGLTAEDFTVTSGNYSNVTVKVEDGWLKIDPIADKVTITITGHTNTTVYDTFEHSISGYEYSISNTLYKVNDFKFTGNDVATRTDAGTTNMGMKPEQFTNISSNFNNVVFVVTDGYQEITPAGTNSVSAQNVSVMYDGIAHSITATPAQSNSHLLYSTDQKTWAETLPTYTNATEAQTVYIKVTNPNYEDAFGNATVTILKRNITLTSGSSAKEYDGTALTNHNVAVSGDGFVTGESATYNVTGTQTESGFSANTFTYAMNEGTNAANYNVTTVNGTLLVRPVTPETPDRPETPETPTRPTTPSTTTNARPSTPNTGDQTNVPFAAGMMSFSMLLAAVAILMKRKYSE